MSITTTNTRPNTGEAAALPPRPFAERYIPQVTNIDPDLAVRTDRPERTGRRGWMARVPVVGRFIAR